ncbi:DNA-binding protein [Vibrio gazogenes]|uniref:DNA-binding protein n=1 Tax=Vibrio gazogenes TaxID=687 RepID=A0A1Z2SCD4_VIBGA|nr:DNA-binding protein [Vibrio gazogenes]ASA54844.1 DNA-binding protein [Vibrio gazogenes]
MTKTIISLTRWLANSMNSIALWLESKDNSASSQSKFVDLAPTDEADKDGVYSEAILFATNNEKVSNIALTGPYGSGKSSIIQSFLKKYRRPALHISLAAFVPEIDVDDEADERKVSRQEIERSILQQMLYGADANKLPLSRFKRIQSPGVWSILKSFYMMLGIVSLWFVFHQREKIISGTFFEPLTLSNWLNLGIFGFAVIFFWVILHHLYVASFGLSLKSISLKSVEIKPAHEDQTSILNRHLDEIVYFFQSTDYDLVIIEDLDRFNNADIFVTLREINSLVNENAGVKRTIRFLYALRDDMFVNTDRTKFFEFIIPVIPIINTSNSIDMVLAEGNRLKLDGRLNRQFLREVSRYLNDLRLIQNIFNEYAIYVANLEKDEENLLDANKLLAILIYKNVYPRDFEQLHRGEGMLANILHHKNELIEQGEATYKAEISELEAQLEAAERQTPSDLKELRQIYAMALIEKLPEDIAGVSLNHGYGWIPLKNLVSHDEFEQLIEASQLNYYYSGRRGHSSRVNVSQWQKEIDSQKSYQQRKEELESKTTDNKNKILSQIRDLRVKLPTLRTTKLNELLRVNTDRIRDLFENFGENGDLARFLILEGYLDDSYYQYTSLFHSGRLSPNDNKFLIQIRAFVTPEPSFPLDNPKEVIAAMRDEDFRQSYVLNVKLVDNLLSDRTLYFEQTKKLFKFLSSEFESCENFFDAYYSSGQNVAGLLSGLANSWDDFVLTAIANNISHVIQIVSNLPENLLKKLAMEFAEFPTFVAENLPEILLNVPGLASERLVCLGFEVKDLAAIKGHHEVVNVMFERGLFELTLANMEYIYQAFEGESDFEPLHKKNFTTIRSMHSPILLQRVERDFDRYLRDILLVIQENSEEDASTILAVICHDELEQDDLRTFLERQTIQLPSLEDVPERLYEMLFKLCMIEPTWLNCLAFMESEGFEVDILVGYLDRDDVRKIILKESIPSDSDSQKLRVFLFNAGSLSDISYKEYVSALPEFFKEFPTGFELSKLRILIDEGKITFTKESLEELSDSRDLQVRFVVANINTYLANPDNFELDDDFLEVLLQSEIDNVAKLGVIKLMDLDALVNLPERAALVGPIINSTDAKISNLDGNIVQSLVIHSQPIGTQISLFNKYHDLMDDDDEVRHVLANLPEPFSEIKTGYNTPRLQNTSENQELVKWLNSRNIISSWSESYFKDEIKVNLYRR